MRRAGHVTLAFLSLAVAGYALVVYGFLPLGAAVHPDLRAAFEANRVALYAHVFGASFALAFAAVMLRLWIPAALVSGVPFGLAYPAIAWLCWVPNLLVAETLFVGPRRAAAREALS